MKTGIELIAAERQEQIEKHGRTIESDVRENSNLQLAQAAETLISKDWTCFPFGQSELFPADWDSEICAKMYSKTYEERLIIAGALIAAELDRLQAIKPDFLQS